MNKQLILDAIEYVNDFDARVEEFLAKRNQEELSKFNTDFKVGGYVVGEDYGKEDAMYTPMVPCKVTKIDGNRVYYKTLDGEEDYEIIGIRVLTAQEIEDYLRKVCDEKYLGKKVKCLFDGETYSCDIFDEYISEIDSIYYNASDGDCIRVYDSGQFAEIVKEDKKPLPKTKKELEEAIDECGYYEGSFSDFINQYEG